MTNGCFPATLGLGLGEESTVEPGLLAVTVTDLGVLEEALEEAPGTAPAVAVAVADAAAAAPGGLSTGLWVMICRPACSWITCPFPPGACCTILILFCASRRM